MGLDVYVDAVVSLALQLEKLLKVINHSDPSAESKKKLLYAKYLKDIKRFAEFVGGRYLWQDVQAFIRGLSNRKIPVADEVKEMIFGKILKDLENELSMKYTLQEFTEREPTFRRRRTKKRKKNLETPGPSWQKPKHYTKDSIMELVQLTQKQVLARASLREFIAKVRKLNPDRIDSKIHQYIRKQNR